MLTTFATVLMTNCQASLQRKSGPVASQKMLAWSLTSSVSSSVAAFLVGGFQSVLVGPLSIEASLGYGCATTKWSETVPLALGLTSQNGFTMKPVAIPLIEDNPGDMRLVAEALKACPVPVELTVAADGETALSSVKERGVECPTWSSWI